ncbi:alpha/beta hydrolase [uncultured Subdoligranulum sp.]|uniref:alpha/beta hydrolase n=1 Tax=uncultured Subdoligranulum sp. TaxID=512298 RepID=UPI00261CD3AB|nr:alpha/beta hydrolase [uncultured Subdoligranulum sp.]
MKGDSLVEWEQRLHKAAEGQGHLKGNVVLCPGGGYEWLSPREAQPVADAFAADGWTVWVLSYTLAAPQVTPGKAPLCQLAEAVRQVRSRQPEKPVVVCGFSAGGHVAASLAVHWQDVQDPAMPDRTVRPDAVVLGYPVITAGTYAHRPSFEALLGPKPQGTASADWERQAQYFSLERHVTQETPPVFLWHTAADELVPVQNSLLFAQQLAEQKVPFEMHIYPYGVHGLSLATPPVEEPEKQRWADPHVAEWFADCLYWLDLVLFPQKGKQEQG